MVFTYIGYIQLAYWGMIVGNSPAGWGCVQRIMAAQSNIVIKSKKGHTCPIKFIYGGC